VTGLSVDVLDAVTGRYKRVLSEIDLNLEAGETLGVTGQSGGGKSTLALTVAGLLPSSARIHATRWTMFGEPLVPGNDGQPLSLSGERLNARIRKIVGGKLFLISQDARSCLIPYRTVAWHLQRARAGASPRELESLLDNLGFDKPAAYLPKLPSELSTGECQRVQFAMATRLPIRCLIADEPFASLDRELAERLTGRLRSYWPDPFSLLLITHHFSILRAITDRTAIICNGCLAEIGPTADIAVAATKAQHPHTRLLLQLSQHTSYGRMIAHAAAAKGNSQQVACVFGSACNRSSSQWCGTVLPPARAANSDPNHVFRCACKDIPAEVGPGALAAQSSAVTASPRPASPRPLLQVVGLAKSLGRKQVLKDVRFEVFPGQRLGLLGPSGTGKTTLARILMGILSADAGMIHRFPGETPASSADAGGHASNHELRAIWKRLQMVYQDSDVLFDPAASIGQSLVQVYRAYDPSLTDARAWQLAAELLAHFRLGAESLEAPPRQLSGGERKRAAIARSLAIFGYLHAKAPPTADRLLIIDEPTVGIDVFLQGILAETLIRAQQELNLTYLVISHDRDFVSRFCCPTYSLEKREIEPANRKTSLQEAAP
jgi:peptide/nickel transport system ATP-binding protein